MSSDLQVVLALTLNYAKSVALSFSPPRYPNSHFHSISLRYVFPFLSSLRASCFLRLLKVFVALVSLTLFLVFAFYILFFWPFLSWLLHFFLLLLLFFSSLFLCLPYFRHFYTFYFYFFIFYFSLTCSRTFLFSIFKKFPCPICHISSSVPFPLFFSIFSNFSLSLFSTFLRFFLICSHTSLFSIFKKFSCSICHISSFVPFPLFSSFSL